MKKTVALFFSGLYNLFSRNNHQNNSINKHEAYLDEHEIPRSPDDVEAVLFDRTDPNSNASISTKKVGVEFVDNLAKNEKLPMLEGEPNSSNAIETWIRGLSPSIAGSIESSPAPFDRDSKRLALAPSPEAGSHNNPNQSYSPAKPFMHGPNLADNSSNLSLKADSPAKLSEDKTHTATASPILYDNHNKISASDILKILDQLPQQDQPSQKPGCNSSIDENSKDLTFKPVANLQINTVGTDKFSGRFSKPSSDVRRFGGVEFQGRGFQDGVVPLVLWTTNPNLTNTASGLVEFDSTKDESKIFSGPLFDKSLSSKDTPSKKPNINDFANTQTDSQPENTNRYNKVKSRVQSFRSVGRSQDLLSKPTESQTLPGSQHKSSGQAVTKVRDEVGDRVTKLQSDDGKIFAECNF
jgi:hypothetical protein